MQPPRQGQSIEGAKTEDTTNSRAQQDLSIFDRNDVGAAVFTLILLLFSLLSGMI